MKVLFNQGNQEAAIVLDSQGEYKEGTSRLSAL